MHLIPIAIVFSALLVPSVQAIDFTATNTYTVARDQTVSGEQWVSAKNIQAEGTFQNDLFTSAGTELLLSGSYAGNLWGMAGSDARVSGTCARNVRLAAPTIRITGTINGNLMAMANTISIGTNAVISGDARLYGNKIIMEGNIKGQLSLTAQTSTTVSGTVQGDTQLTAAEIILSDDARFHGNLTYTTDKELIPAENVVEGKLQRKELPDLTLQWYALWLFAALITGIAFISLFPMTTAMASLIARKSPMKCLLVGIVASIGLPILARACLTSLVGLPLGILIFSSWAILVYISQIIIAVMIGSILLRSNNPSAGRVLLTLAAGLSVIYLLTSLIGLLIASIVIPLGVGALILAMLQKRRLIIQVPEELKQLEALKHEQNKSTEESL